MEGYEDNLDNNMIKVILEQLLTFNESLGS